MVSEKKIKQEIEKIAFTEGFVEIGYLNITQAHFPGWLDKWLENNYHADMQWMENHREIRENPCSIIENGKTIISFLYPYHTEPPEAFEKNHLISNYAWGKDYHKEIKKKLKRTKQAIKEIFPEFEGRYFVDSAPIPEKIVAAASGLGWIGKNSLLLNRKYGSYIFIAEMVCNFDLVSSEPVKNYCGKCSKCSDLCPTKAIVDDKIVDSNKCISFLTIEKKGDFSMGEASYIEHQLFGCDICQQVCPWNKKVVVNTHSDYQCFERWQSITPQQILDLTESEFETLKINSPVKRAGLANLKRNASAILKA